VPGDQNKNNYMYKANCCTLPGHYDSYNVGDKVYVGFLNEDLSLPIILGKIYQGHDELSRSHINAQSINISSSAHLPVNTKIGDIEYKQLVRLFNKHPKTYYNHLVILQAGDTLIKFNFMNSAEYKYSGPDDILDELYRLYADSAIRCEIADANSKIFTDVTYFYVFETSQDSYRYAIRLDNEEITPDLVLSERVVQI
jgi:hypothetical protein